MLVCYVKVLFSFHLNIKRFKRIPLWHRWRNVPIFSLPRSFLLFIISFVIWFFFNRITRFCLCTQNVMFIVLFSYFTILCYFLIIFLERIGLHKQGSYDLFGPYFFSFTFLYTTWFQKLCNVSRASRLSQAQVWVTSLICVLVKLYPCKIVNEKSSCLWVSYLRNKITNIYDV